MAASLLKPAPSLLLVALLALLVIDGLSSARLLDGGTGATTDDLSGDVCSGTLDPPFCHQVMKSIPGAERATSLESLGETAIAFARSEGTKTSDYAQSLAGSATSPRLKENYRSCAENYDNAVGDLEDAQGMLKNKDYPGVSTKASGSMSEVDDCGENFKPPTTDPSQLPQKNKYFNMLSVIVLRVANKLHGAA